MNSQAVAGFRYLVETIDKDGIVIESEVVDNLIPTEGINHILSVAFKGSSQVTTWYLGLFEANYTPAIGDTAATLPGLATESTAYTSGTRVAWVSGAVAGGSVDNVASRAEFTANATKTIYGGFLSSSPAKGAATGVLTSIVRFASPRVLDSGSILRVTAGLTITST